MTSMPKIIAALQSQSIWHHYPRQTTIHHTHTKTTKYHHRKNPNLLSQWILWNQNQCAIEIYSSQLEQEPSNAKLREKIGEAYHKKARCYQLLSKSPFSNEAEEAVQNYTKALEYVPNSANR